MFFNPYNTINASFSSIGFFLTCSKPLFNEGESVPRAEQLDVAAGQCAALAGELHCQRRWLTGAVC